MEPAKQELKKLGSGEELALFTAVENPKIRNSSIDELRQVLRLVMIKIGLRSQNWPSDEEKVVLIEHIVSKFGGHTCEEIKLAFDMLIAGKLEEVDSKGNIQTLSANCYENFSCLYFSEVMNCYRRWAQEAIKHAPKEQPKEIENKKSITDEEMEEWVEDWKVKIKEIENPIMIPPNFYDWLCKKELLVLTNEEKRDYITNQAVVVRHHFLTLLSKTDGEHSQAYKDLEAFNAMRLEGCFVGIEIERLKELAKKIAVFDYLKANQK